ncbi:MAG: hypothetical protein K2Y21_04240 [Phycisphaerales bacterium]|nr:hypothetical protein [Phycisphaerales bacterium]
MSIPIACATTLVLAAGIASAAPSLPGVGIRHYGEFPADYRPTTITLGTDGSVYAGSNDNAVTGAFIRRVPPGGGSSVLFSNNKIFDPDGVLFDATGAFSGVANSLLVACSGSNEGFGVIYALRPDGTQLTVAGPLQVLNNNDSMAFNSQKVLYVNVYPNERIVRFSGQTPVPVIALTGTGGGSVMVIDDLDRLWVTCADGSVRRYGSDDVLQATIALGPGADPAVAFCPGGAMTKGTYVLNNQSHVLSRIDAANQLVPVGTGFPQAYGITFDAAGNLYVAAYQTGEVFRSGCPADLNSDGLIDDADFSIFAVAYDILDCADPAMPALYPADLNRDALVDDADFGIFVVAYNDVICG